MEFSIFGKAVNDQIKHMSKHELFDVAVDKDTIWNLYLTSFPSGTNPIYKERTEHDCNCCKKFIRDMGSAVAIKSDNTLESIWDINVGGFYQEVADALSEHVKKQAISNVLSTESTKVGANETLQQLEDGQIKTWNHLYSEVPREYADMTPTGLSNIKATKQVFKRGLDEITESAVDIVLELSGQNSLYKGEEFANTVRDFLRLKRAYHMLDDLAKKDNFCWLEYKSPGARIRNTAIGTLLQDISEGMDLDSAVKSYEVKVAPTNYKRPTALITKGMIDLAMKTIKELDLEESLYRRYAVAEDLSVNNVLFADRSTAILMQDSILNSLMASVKESQQNFSKVEEISIEHFITLIPSITQMELLVGNGHIKNLMSLIAPKHKDSRNILKWSNNFSWTYNGDITDSIKEKIKRAGGNVDVFLRTSLSWFNYDDLDIHVLEPCGNLIYYSSKRNHITTGQLDIDMNAGHGGTREAVENIVWTDPKRMGHGKYQVIVHNYCKRETIDVGFVVEMEIGGEIKTYSYAKAVKNNEKVKVISFTFDGEKVSAIKVGNDIEDKAISQNIWDVQTEKFQKVSLMTISPNHWNDEQVGNKHYFFILENCKNPDKARGIYNEFINHELEKHRKVFEVLGNKTKCDASDNQLSGLGFSSTKRDSVICKVSGNFNRILKVNF